MNLRERSERMVRRLESHVGEDVWMVLEASGALDLKEFEFFCLAWRNWTGEAPDLQRMEKVFARYMFRKEVPPWTRHLAREVLRRRAQGRLSADDFGAAEVRAPRVRPPRARIYAATAAVSAAFVVALLILGTYNATPPERLECSPGGMRFAEVAAKHFTGKADPFACKR